MKEYPGIANEIIASINAQTSVKSEDVKSQNAFANLFKCTHSVQDVIKNHILENEDEDPFFVCDIGQVVRQHIKWVRNLPRIEPFYAVKCCGDPLLLKTMVSMGTGFDCASRGEMQNMLNYGVPPSKIIYANPCKQNSHIRFASEKGIEMMTFDNVDELYKVKKYHKSAKMVLRVLIDDSNSLCKFSSKFGASPSAARELLEKARELGINVIGVSFHVGSGCFASSSFRDAVLVARNVFDIGKELGFDFTLLDVGGGFPGSDNENISFGEVCEVLRTAVDKYFPAHVRVIAEPGRYYSASAFTIATNIIARRIVKRDGSDDGIVGNDDHPSFMYYINDGIYGSFNSIMFDHQHPRPKPLCKNGQFLFDNGETRETEFNCSVWGPTCDSLDCLSKNTLLPELDVGDWLYFDEMGAYTISAASEFNGFKKSKILYTNTETTEFLKIAIAAEQSKNLN
ncbi:ornithine decarboxylase [Piromyces finnis]|uniref:ornithine decarboxylase n=1 Tax=Piromyces finnis TaxID=1754191 RepID=A0A1Y1VC66_9FUNG|nr:ornithine decarboxylase [Piromyces finnis]|eukprot:ORX52269.1 ornithine decarboxylase [Piromyces finnis]